MTLSIIVAVAENRVIGKDNDLVWRLPADLRYFKNTTMGHPVVMGRKTYESFNSPLKGRTNIIVTRNPDYRQAGCIIVHNLQEAYEKARQENPEEIFILGGEEIYRQALPDVEKIYLTEVHDQFEGDAFFPELDDQDWEEVKREDFEPDEKNNHPYSFVQLRRRKN